MTQGKTSPLKPDFGHELALIISAGLLTSLFAVRDR
jgi:hypothetical protein